MAEAAAAHGARRLGAAAGGRRRAPDGDGAPLAGERAGKRLQQLRLTVAGDTGDADDLAGVDGEAHVVDAKHAAAIAHREVLDLQQGLARRSLFLVHAEQYAAAHHHRGELRAVGLGRRYMIDHAAGAHHGDAVGQRHDLAQLVGDQDDGPALVSQRPQDAKEVVDLLRREHTRRLVEDQDVGAAVECLQNLHPLLQADGQRAHDGVGVDVEPVLALNPLELLPGFLQGGPQQVTLLHAEHTFSSTVNVSTSMKCWWTMPCRGRWRPPAP